MVIENNLFCGRISVKQLLDRYQKKLHRSQTSHIKAPQLRTFIQIPTGTTATRDSLMRRVTQW